MKLVLLSQYCANVQLTDTRDQITGEQLYHDCTPNQLVLTTTNRRRKRPNFHERVLSYYQNLPYPNNYTTNNNTDWIWMVEKDRNNNSNYTCVGEKYGLNAAAPYSISFHKIYHPLYIARIHSILNSGVCPLESSLHQENY